MKNGYRVVDIDTHVNPSYDTLVKYVNPSFRSRLDELKPYVRTVGGYNALSIASIPFDRFPGEAPWRAGSASRRATTVWTLSTASATRTPPVGSSTWTWRAGMSM